MEYDLKVVEKYNELIGKSKSGYKNGKGTTRE
jgi:hypothetical protein